jgi:hypothetical protein
MIDSLGDVQQAINGAVAWTIKRDVMEAKR